MVTTVSYPVAPPVTPLRGTLLDVASVSEDFAWLDGTDLFDSYNCMKFQADATFCAPNSKTFDQAATWQDGIKFAVYGGVACKAVGLDMAHMESEVKRVFESGESTAVERALMEKRFIAGTTWAAPVDVNPGGAVAPAVGVALLEGYAASEYVGVPTLHMPRSIASLMARQDALVWEGNVLHTKMGTAVAAGAGYDFPNSGPTGAAAAAGEKWLFATGGVLVGRSDSIVRQVMAHTDNDVFVLAERGYIAAVDCFTAAVRVSVTA